MHKGTDNVKTVNYHTYLGTIIENNGSNRLNVQAKVSKGKAAIRDIFQILNGIFFGSFYFEAVKILRESLLISVITHNLEAAFNLSDSDIKALADLDFQLFCGCLNIGAKSSKSLILLELGLVSIPYILKKKRILFL